MGIKIKRLWLTSACDIKAVLYVILNHQPLLKFATYENTAL